MFLGMGNRYSKLRCWTHKSRPISFFFYKGCYLLTHNEASRGYKHNKHTPGHCTTRIHTTNPNVPTHRIMLARTKNMPRRREIQKERKKSNINLHRIVAGPKEDHASPHDPDMDPAMLLKTMHTPGKQLITKCRMWVQEYSLIHEWCWSMGQQKTLPQKSHIGDALAIPSLRRKCIRW